MFPPVPTRARGASRELAGLVPRWLPCLVVASLLGRVPATAQVDAERTYDLWNGDLTQGLVGWTSVSLGTGGSVQPGLLDGAAVATLLALPGGELRLVRELQPGGPEGLSAAPEPGRAGERPVWRARVRVDPGAGSGELSLWVLREGSSGSAVCARSAVLPANELPRGRWFDLVAEGVPGVDGGLAPDTSALRIELRSSLALPVHLERLEGGRAVPHRHPLPDPGFEAGAPGWDLALARVERGREATPARRGHGCLALDGGGSAHAELALGTGWGTPWAGERLALGAWVWVDDHPALPASPQASQELRLRLVARGPAGDVLLGVARWRPVRRAAGRWWWLEVEPAQALPAATQRLELLLESSLPSTARVDELELGSPEDVDGVPLDLVLCSQVGWYRAPEHPAASGPTTGPRERWGNWAWTTGSALEPWSPAFVHDPDLLRANGRRDGAVGEVDGPDALPLVGLYDSRDADVARLTVELARAAGVDGLLVDWHGLALDALVTPVGEAPLQTTALEVLLDAADRPGCDLAVGVMVEPKVHQLGWVHPGSTPAQRREAFLEELLDVVRRVAHRRCALRIDGELLLGVFWHDVPGWDGVSWDNGDWSALELEVEQRSGVPVRLLATHPPGPGASPFTDAVRWHLADAGVLRYPSYAAFQSAQPSPVAAAAVRAAARAVDEEALAWAAAVPGRRALATVWPGFDDSGVAGWGATNGLGSDGLPLCVRVSAPPGPGFLLETLGAAREAGLRRLHLMSWNDWNERTALEPRWDPLAAQALDAGLPLDPATRERVIGPLLALQASLGQPDAPALEAPLRRYWARRAAGIAVRYR